jgi:hypothetical protein
VHDRRCVLEVETAINEGFGDDAMGEKPCLVLTCWVRGKPFAYKCSRCGQSFLFPEDRTPKEGASELWAAFKEHVQEEHPEDADSTRGSGDAANERT